ncbi:GNAT family N-acetyltransferase [Limosilactobacillus reuteri]|uniref:GNAT family N-acetyltransferase n=1 Tax=Limosilactobacillus reuteri TaxID=1598 RepID=UPI003D778E2F
MWKVKHFQELSTIELYKIMHLRTATFVVEQKRIYQEVDKNDLQAIHIFKEDNDGEVVAYARVFLLNDNTVTFGRVVTSKKVRGQGVGKELLNQIMKTITQSFPNKKIEIEAQAQVRGYYERAGFTAEGDEFIFESTPHVKMIHEPVRK